MSSLQVLVVEDNQQSRELISEMLAILGYRARSVGSAEEALECLKTQTFDIMLADINLPGMSGIDLAKKALRDFPQLKVIFASGYGYLITDKTNFDFVLLPKPYDLAQLEHALVRVSPPPPPSNSEFAAPDGAAMSPGSIANLTPPTE